MTHPQATPASLSTLAHVLVTSLDAPVVDAHDFHHLTKVLRARSGEAISVTNGAGSWRPCVVPSPWTDPSIELTPTGDIVHLHARSARCVAFSLVKGDKPEFVVQKLTEAGIDRIVILKASRSVVKWDPDRAGKHLNRLNLVAREALMQSRGVWLPSIEGPISPLAFIAAETAAGRIAAVAQFGGGPLLAEVDSVLIGPEGGWALDEFAAFSRTLTLGDQIYRAETAAVAAGVLLAAVRAHVLQ